MSVKHIICDMCTSVHVDLADCRVQTTEWMKRKLGYICVSHNVSKTHWTNYRYMVASVFFLHRQVQHLCIMCCFTSHSLLCEYVNVYDVLHKLQDFSHGYWDFHVYLQIAINRFYTQKHKYGKYSFVIFLDLPIASCNGNELENLELRRIFCNNIHLPWQYVEWIL